MGSMERRWNRGLMGLGLAGLAMALMFVSSVWADPKSGETEEETPAQRAEATVGKLKAQLALNPTQETQLLAIYQDYYEKTEALRAAGSDESEEARAQRREKRQNLKTELQAKLATVLTPAQLEQYTQLQEKRHEEGRKRWQGHGGEKEDGERSGGEKESSE
jgi:Spy/CpxP family protein refolding chaperone